MLRASSGDLWLALTRDALPVAAVHDWAIQPSCGAVALFSGTVRDHAPGRDGVVELEYEAYDEQVVPRMEAIADEARARWPAIGRIGMLHRVGRLTLGEVAVVVAVSAPHRGEAFDAARYCIDTLKASVPIWKKETWADGSEWGTDAQAISDVEAVGS